MSRKTGSVGWLCKNCQNPITWNECGGLPFDKEAVILYALTKGYLDNIDFEDIANFEQALYKEMEINEKGDIISSDVYKSVIKVVNE